MVNTVKIDVSLVRGLIASQFTDWADLPIEEVQPNGHDNRTFRLGSEMSVRLPSHECYVAQVEKEQEWLPKLAPHIPLQIPRPLALGVPDSTYPWQWSVYRWIEGQSALIGWIDNLDGFAEALAQFLRALHLVETEGGPEAGQHNFFRGGSLSVYDTETRTAIEVLDALVDHVAVTEVWEAALQTTWQEDPVWVHGDLAPSNLLVRSGCLVAILDFGCSGVGDPACDLAISWTLLSRRSRAVFREHLAIDDSTWARGRGWTLWKALKILAHHRSDGSDEGKEARRIVDAVVAEHEAAA